MATIYSSGINKSCDQVKMPLATKKDRARTINPFFAKSKDAMKETLKRDLSSIKSIKWK